MKERRGKVGRDWKVDKGGSRRGTRKEKRSEAGFGTRAATPALGGSAFRLGIEHGWAVARFGSAYVTKT